ncbi:MAG: ABC transporter substrate-binding protein [Desulfobacteraceae bacterium]|nr:MAG: ABC transporter substrate-binding protein [Desulfobacteraceae bacterium]
MKQCGEKKHHRKGRLALPVIFLVLALMVMAFHGNAHGAPDRNKTLVIGVGRDFYDGPDSRAYLHGSTHTWEALTYLGDGLAAEPWLAESWRSEDNGRVWIFTLRDGVKFHDGSDLTADLAKASIERIASRPKYDAAGMYRDLVRIETRGRLELIFYLRDPSPAFPNIIAYYSSPIIHPKVFGENGRLTGLTATGPFRVHEIKVGERIIIDAFPDYWGKKPGYARVVFRTILDARSRVVSLLAGEIDAIADVGGILPQQAGEIRKASGMALKQVEVATTHYLLINCRKPPFDDQNARQWLAGILDREELTAALVPGAGKPATGPYTPLAANWTFEPPPSPSESFPLPRPDFSGAAIEFLLHSGTLDRWPYRDLSQITQALLVASGVNATIVIRESGAYYDDLREGRFHLALQPNTLMTGDPDFFYSYYVHSEGFQQNGCQTSEMDELIVAGRHAMDGDHRREIYRRLTRWMAETLPLIPLYHDISFYAHGPGVSVFSMDHYFRPLLLEARPGNQK